MKLKNILLSGLSLVLVAALAIGGTVAYLQDDDSDVNVMTLGNVSIAQHEYEREVDADGKYVLTTSTRGEGYKLKDFTQGKPLYPTTESTNNGAGGWDSTYVYMDQEQAGSAGYMQVFSSKLAQDKFVFVENTGKTDAYVRTLVAFEIGSKTYEEWKSLIASSHHFTWEDMGDIGPIEIDGNNYIVAEFTYKGYDGGRHVGGVLPAGETTYCSLAQVYMYSTATNEDCEALDGNNNGTYDILVLSQAIQTAGFDDAQTALDTGFGDVTAANAAKWFDGVAADIPVVVSTSDELKAALAKGGDVVLANDIALENDTTIVIGTGVDASLNLNGYTLSSENTRTATHNFMIDVSGGAFSAYNGTIEMKHTGADMGWSCAATVINVTAGGVLNLENVTVENLGGTAMNFAVHLNNWGEVTMNASDCVFKAPYCSVRVFNSGADMNNVKIENSTLTGKKMAFWVHNYDASDLGTWYYADGTTGAYDQTKIDARLNLDIYGNNNTFAVTATEGLYPSPIRYGFNGSVFYDANGNIVE